MQSDQFYIKENNRMNQMIRFENKTTFSDILILNANVMKIEKQN